ncbi:MAG: iron ABC transporter [Verrucomicrobiales bacterium]|nr:iron ABC transporter [Verrucomicrobiales bacterium]|tara:strand:- start:3138 stop:4022 length:885 start_codon:yes stop_codon:yes gene_type:complete
MNWIELDTWIAATAAVTAMACVIPGLFLFLSRQSMMTHGVAHAVLPGIVIAFLITHTRDWTGMMIGAVLASIATGVLTSFFQSFGRVEPGAALGITFTTMFALGLVLLRVYADFVHIEPNHVLYGNLELSVLDSNTPPPVFVRSLFILAVNLVLMLLFFKELTISTFDPELACSLGFKPQLVQYGIMSVTATTAVVAFESVGSILVIAMMIAPPATAYLITKDLKKMVVLAFLLAAGTAFIGHLLSIRVFGGITGALFGLERIGATNTAGGISVVCGALFLAVLFVKRERQVGF